MATAKPHAKGKVAPGDTSQRVGVEQLETRGANVKQLVEKLIDAAGAEFTTYYYYTILRMYLAAHEGSYAVMPGGLTRVSASADTMVVSMQRGGGSKDTWVLSDGPVSQLSLLGPGGLPLPGLNTPLPHSAPNAASSPFYTKPYFPFYLPVLGIPPGTPGFINPNAYPGAPGITGPHALQFFPQFLSSG